MQARKKKPVGKLLAYGLGSVGLYTAVYLLQDLMMANFARGGVYTVLPIATVFLFSWVHGTFAGTLWEVLGIDAVKKAPAQTAAQAPARKDTRPRAAVSA
ncbi:hypothetical protein NNJEOMEG_02442 [Fundidesulfovibrio magnetotacticus]|uniref:Uncharacterized protein n=1 Tax=Fundidesulfovibrio magnetotacticus TaxID=2730080 RepID=A0A6V8M2C1_9BACT|nr:hypothetical protein [Fundidesulfovibrio magnetotacticus]GFK94595.1 hypothetical protein NNJEOMEG_02442 [Fundidesulfovibrio magnetotacticus]